MGPHSKEKLSTEYTLSDNSRKKLPLYNQSQYRICVFALTSFRELWASLFYSTEKLYSSNEIQKKLNAFESSLKRIHKAIRDVVIKTKKLERASTKTKWKLKKTWICVELSVKCNMFKFLRSIFLFNLTFIFKLYGWFYAFISSIHHKNIFLGFSLFRF